MGISPEGTGRYRAAGVGSSRLGAGTTGNLRYDAVGRKRSTLLPAVDMAQMFAGKVDVAVRLVQQLVLGRLVFMPVNPWTEVERHFLPSDRDRMNKVAAMTR